MKKLFAGLVATSMVAAMGTSAMAAVNEYALNPTVNEETGVAKISEADVAKLDDYADTQMTVLIIPEAAYNKLTDDDDETNITDDDIYYIDQMAANDTNLFQKMGLKCGADLIPEGETSATYYVRVGGAYDINDGIYQGSFTVTKTSEEEVVKITFYMGDVTGDNASDSTDAAKIVSTLVGGSYAGGAKYDIGAKVELIVPVK